MIKPLRAPVASLVTSLLLAGSCQALDYPRLGYYDDGLGNGNTSLHDNYVAFTAAVGQNAYYYDLFVNYLDPMSNWVNDTGWSAWAMRQSTTVQNMTPVVNFGLVDGNNFSYGYADGMFQSIARGDKDAMYKAMLQQLANQGYNTICLRIAWEQNTGPYEPWYATNDGTIAAHYVAAWQRVANIAHNVNGMGVAGMNVKTVWSPSVNLSYTVIATDATYPGDTYADIIGPDCYSPTNPPGGLVDFTTGQAAASSDAWAANYVNREHRWDYPNSDYYNQTNDNGYGFLHALNLARTHNKPFALSETGAGTKNGFYGPFDEADFPLYLADRLSAAIFQGMSVEYVVVWNDHPGDGYWSFTEGNRPLESAAWANFAQTMAHAVNHDLLPAGQTDQDIGGSSPAGSATYSYNGGYSIQGAGADIWGSSDQFNYVSQDLTGDQTLVTCVTGLVNPANPPGTNSYAKAGLMFRDGTSATALFAMVDVRANGAVECISRTNGGIGCPGWHDTGRAPSPTTPVWLKLVKSGGASPTYTAYCATTTTTPGASDWLLVASTAPQFGGASTFKGGLVVCSHTSGSLVTGTFASPYRDRDVGGLYPPGLASVSGGGVSGSSVYTLQGGGADFYGNSDQGNFSYKVLSDAQPQTLVARLTSYVKTDWNEKAGIMFRDSTLLPDGSPDPAAPYMFAEVYGGNGVQLITRTSAGAAASYQGGPALQYPVSTTHPVWLRLVRSGGTIAASYALTVGTPAAGDWVAINAPATPIAFSNGACFGGMAATSHNGSVLTTATFDNVSQ